jgi:hypothetical protein
MQTPLKNLCDDLAAAEARLAEHLRLENERADNGLELDAERYEAGRETRD